MDGRSDITGTYAKWNQIVDGCDREVIKRGNMTVICKRCGHDKVDWVQGAMIQYEPEGQFVRKFDIFECRSCKHAWE